MPSAKTKQLVPRTFVSNGSVHYFRDNTTLELKIRACTFEEYNALAGGHNFPSLDGHTWVGSANGSIQVDSPSGLLGPDEYCSNGSTAYVAQISKQGHLEYKYVPSASVDAENKIDSDTLL